jgi:hypothetical protein
MSEESIDQSPEEPTETGAPESADGLNRAQRRALAKGKKTSGPQQAGPKGFQPHGFQGGAGASPMRNKLPRTGHK